jgi:hypothetical protein
MSFDDGMTQAERDFFASRGRNTDQILAENPGLNQPRSTDETPAQPAPGTDGAAARPQVNEKGVPHIPSQEQGVTPPAHAVTQPTTEAPSGSLADDQDEPGPEGHPRRVTWNKYKQLLDQQAQWQNERQQYVEKFARADERLRLINEAMQDQQPPQDEDPPPDPLQDAYAYMQWQDRQRERDREQFQEYVQRQSERDAHDSVVRAYQEDAQRVSAANPLFAAQYAYLMQHRDAQYQVLRPDLNPQQRKQAIREEEWNTAREFLESGRSPAEGISQMARLYGFDGWFAAEQEKARAQTQAQPGAPTGNGAAPPAGAAAPTLGGPIPGARAPQAGTPSAVERIAAINQNQTASRSLSQTGGGTPVVQVDAQALANMSEEEFAAYFSHLQNTGNKARLRELMGS